MTQPAANLPNQPDDESSAMDVPPPRRPLTWKNGGWLFGLLIGVSLIAAYSMLFLFPRHRGDGQHVESYGFELNRLSVPREQIIPAGIPRDYFVALDNPATFNLEQVAQENKKNPYRKFLLDHDRVIGVQIGGEARAYPLNTLRLHGVINDTLGGQPILVTYDTLCDSGAVFARNPFGQSGLAGLNLPRFGVSGLVYNSNMLMYDHEPAGESLWIQMEGRAISGPGLGTQLPRLAFVLISWKVWLRAHPETRVMAPEPVSEQPFKDTIFTPYFTTDKLNYPVSPAWDVRRYPNKSPVLAVRWVSPGQTEAGRWRVFVIPGLAKLSAEERERVLAVPGIKLRWEEDAGVEVSGGGGGGSLWAEPTEELVGREPGGHLETVYGFVFAWYGLHPGEGGEGVVP